MVCAAERIDKLRRHTDAGSRLANTALKHVTDAQFPADLLHVHGSALVDEARVARDHEEPAQPGQRRDNVLGHAIAEVLLLRIAAHVDEGEDGDGRLVALWRQSWHGSGSRSRSNGHPVDPDGPCNVLDLDLAQIVEREVHLVEHLIAGRAGNADFAWFGQLLETGGDVHTIAVKAAASTSASGSTWAT